MLLKRVNNLFAQYKKRKENVPSGVPYGTIIARLNNFLCRMNKLFILFKQDNSLFPPSFSWMFSLLLKDLITDFYLSCRSNKLFVLFKQDNNWFKRLIVSFEQVILSC